jgi:hypothetical protein
MIHTYAIIIAATLNTIRYSISLFHCLTGDETGVAASGTTSRLTHPGQGCPQRSQLQLACASASRSGNTSNAMFFNISLVVSASSVNNRVVSIESLLVRLNANCRCCSTAVHLLAFALQKLRSPFNDDYCDRLFICPLMLPFWLFQAANHDQRVRAPSLR